MAAISVLPVTPNGIAASGRSPLGAMQSTLPATRETDLANAIASNHGASTMKDKRILVVEDEALIAMHLVSILDQAAAEPIGPAATAQDALRLIENGTLDAALLDAKLRGGLIDEVALALTRRNVPFAFVTGYDRRSLPDGFEDAAVLFKPFTPQSLLDLLGKLLAQRSEPNPLPGGQD